MNRRQFFRALLGWLVVAETVRQGANVLGAILKPEQPTTLENPWHPWVESPITYVEGWEGVEFIQYHALK